MGSGNSSLKVQEIPDTGPSQRREILHSIKVTDGFLLQNRPSTGSGFSIAQLFANWFRICPVRCSLSREILQTPEPFLCFMLSRCQCTEPIEVQEFIHRLEVRVQGKSGYMHGLKLPETQGEAAKPLHLEFSEITEGIPNLEVIANMIRSYTIL